MPPEGELRAAIVQDAETGRVLMLAWMDAEAERRTRESGEAWFWSRSREEYWHKGETSGNTLAVEELRDDCDGDALLVRVRPAGPGVPHRLALVLRAGALAHDRRARARAARGLVHDEAARRGHRRACARRSARRRSRSSRAALAESDERVVAEAADLVYHLYVLLAARGARRRRGRGRAGAPRFLEERLRDHVDDHEQQHRDVDAGDEQDPRDRRLRLGRVRALLRDERSRRFFASGASTPMPMTNVAAKPSRPKITQKWSQPSSAFSIIAMPAARTTIAAGAKIFSPRTPPASRSGRSRPRLVRARR